MQKESDEQKVKNKEGKNKTCNKCGFIGECNLFVKDRDICKKCQKERVDRRADSQKDKNKTCSKCGFIGEVNLFVKNSNVCKKCAKENIKQRIENENNENKICSKCGFVGEKSLFVKGQNVCKKCLKEYQKKQREINNNDEDKVCSRCGFTGKSSLFPKGQSVCNKCKNKYIRQRKENDPIYKLMCLCRSTVTRMLKQQGSSKNGKSCITFFPFTEYSLYKYIEEQFSLPENLDNNGNVWMTWKNQGVYKPKTWNDNDSSTFFWQLDHIIPQSKLPYSSMEDENFKKCWSLDNLRPYSAKQNIIDGNRR